MLSQKKWLRNQSPLGRLRRLLMGTRVESGLTEILHLSTADSDVEDQLHWIERLLRWLVAAGPAHVETRARYLLQILDRNPAWARNLQLTWVSALSEASWFHLFTQVGLAVEHGLWGDIASRLSDRLVPRDAGADVHAMLMRVFIDESRIAAVAQLAPETLAKLHARFTPPEDFLFWTRVGQQAEQALLALAIHIAHYGLGVAVRNSLARADQVTESPFYRLSREVGEGTVSAETLESAERGVQRVYLSLEQSGVSVDVVNRLETLSALLERIRRIRRLLDSPGDVPARDYLVDVLTASLSGRQVLAPLRRHFYLLSRKIDERNGHSAEHYIAQTPAERWTMFRSAIGGGMIVVLMTVAKIAWIHAAPPPLFLAIGIWIIYSAGFLGMQFSGATLATKIPSFTASRIAALFRNVSKERRGEFRAEFRATLASQALALAGNVAGLIPLAFVVNEGWIRSFGSAYLDAGYSEHVLHDLHPLQSFVIPLAALTGVQLWLSSVAGGWFENWVVYRRLPEVISRNRRLRLLLSERWVDRMSQAVTQHSSAFAANVSLGFLFGFIPLAGSVVGANWNGHHVTISSASAVLAFSSLGFEPGRAVAVWAILGLLCVGAMNFGVSFGLALFVAANAQKVRVRRVLRYLRASL